MSGRDEEALKGKSAIDVLRLDEFDLNGSEQIEMVKCLSENSDKVLVLLDGADEGGDLWTKSKGLEKIFERKGALRNCSFEVSSRPCEAAYQLIPVCDRHFHLAGLNDQRLDELLVRRLGKADGRAVASELEQAKWSQLRALMKETPLIDTVIAQIFVRDLISYVSYFWRKVRNLVAYENHTRIQVYLTPPSLYENL